MEWLTLDEYCWKLRDRRAFPVFLRHLRQPGGQAHPFLYNPNREAAPPFAVFKGWATTDARSECSSVIGLIR